MKKLNIIAFIICILIMAFVCILSSCSKPNLDPILREKSVTYLLHVYDEKNQFIKTDTSIHWHRVSGDDLTRFESKGNGEITFCGTYNRLELVIGDACKKY